MKFTQKSRNAHKNINLNKQISSTAQAFQFKFAPAKPKDANQITQFQLAMAYETEKLKLDTKICRKGVRAVFKNKNIGTYYGIYTERKLVGSLLIVKEWSDWRNGFVWWIHSLYILPEYRAKGLFSRFFEYIKIESKKKKARGLRLYVDHTNLHARKVYSRLGMKNDHYDLFELMF